LKTLSLSQNKAEDAEPHDTFGSSSEEGASVIISDEAQLCHMAKFVDKYALSSREAKALSRIIHSEESLKIISSKEYVSERTFQRYLTKIYEKTGTKTRAGLVAAYHKEFLDTDGGNSEISPE